MFLSPLFPEDLTKSLLPLKPFLKPYHDMIIIELLFPITSWNARVLFALTLFELCVMNWLV
jgi:hypothetical protein